MPSRNSYSVVRVGCAGLDQRGLGGRAAHVERDQVRLAERRAQARRAGDAGRRARADDEDRALGRLARSDHAPVGGHDQQRGAHAAAREAGGEIGEIALHRGQEIAVHHRGAGALVLLHLGQHGPGRAHRHPGDGLAHEALGGLLVRGIRVAVDEADRDRPARPPRPGARPRARRRSRRAAARPLPSAPMRSSTSSRRRRGTSGTGFSHVRS